MLVVNVFTDFTNPPPRVPTALGPVRFQEESRAAARLGFESLALNFTEAVCRNWAYAAPGRLFGGSVFDSDRPVIGRLQSVLEELLGSITFDRLMLPLGVGWHVDHLLCHRASVGYHTNPKTQFYEDMPYTLIPNALLYRLRELGDVPSSDLPHWWSAGSAAARVVNEWAPIQKLSPMIRWGARWITPIFFARLFRQSRARWIGEGPSWVSRAEERGVQRSEWVDAVMDYHTQAGAFFKDRASLERELKNPPHYWSRSLS